MRTFIKTASLISAALFTSTALMCSAQANPAASHGVAITLPGGEHGLDLDDMAYMPALHRIVVPAGQTGALVFIDPDNNALTSIPGIAPQAAQPHGRDEGTSSAAYGADLLFASDHTDKAIAVVDPAHKRVLARAPLASGSDYIRYLAEQHEVWVTEPEAAQIEVFGFNAHAKPMLTPKAKISIPGGPESLVFDSAHHRAYANLWKTKTVVIDTATHQVVSEWPNGCEGSRGLAMDPAHARLFVACKEGAVSVLSLKANGKVLAHAKSGAGIDIIVYSPVLHHLYVPGAKSATLTIFDVAPSSTLTPLVTYPTAEHAHCVAADNQGHVYVCNPHGGGVIAFRDSQTH
ncbi:MAG: YncE family protein [Gammaproteobacteria bacterium]